MNDTRELPTNLTENVSSKCFVYRHGYHQKRKSVVFSYARGADYAAVKEGAVAFALSMNRRLGPGPPRSPQGRMSSRNTSHYVGVSPAKTIHRRPSGAEYTYYQWKADWIGCPNSGGVAWQCNKHTDDDAYVLAVLTRRLRTINRGRVLEELAAIKQTDEYREVLSKKPQRKP